MLHRFPKRPLADGELCDRQPTITTGSVLMVSKHRDVSDQELRGHGVIGNNGSTGKPGHVPREGISAPLSATVKMANCSPRAALDRIDADYDNASHKQLHRCAGTSEAKWTGREPRGGLVSARGGTATP
jgi:hypothetical protein